MKNNNFLEQLEIIKHLLKSGQMNYDDAKKEAEIPLRELNIKASKIAEKYGKKHYPFSFAKLMR